MIIKCACSQRRRNAPAMPYGDGIGLLASIFIYMNALGRAHFIDLQRRCHIISRAEKLVAGTIRSASYRHKIDIAICPEIILSIFICFDANNIRAK